MKFTELSESKDTKAEVDYQSKPHAGQRCQHCTMWLGSNKCSQVMGNISPDGWCKLWEPVSYKSRTANESMLDEDWKSNLRKLITMGALSLTVGAGITSKMAYDRWAAAHPQVVQNLSTPDAQPTANKMPPMHPRSTPSISADPDKIVRPMPRPDDLSTNNEPSGQRPQARPTLDTIGPFSKELHHAAVSSGITGDELVAFMSQAAHETGMFNNLEETGSEDYFKKYDPKYSPKTASILGNTENGDGYKYRGRGFLHLTGRENYARAEKALGYNLIDHPDLAANPSIAADIAVWFWKTRVQPNVTDFTDVKSVTHRINPKYVGLDDRKEKYQYVNSLVKRFSMDVDEGIKPKLFSWLINTERDIL